MKNVTTGLLILFLLAVSSCATPSTKPTPTPTPAPAPATAPTPAPVSEILPAEHPTDFPENLRWLTDEEKERAIEMALSTPAALQWQQRESHYTVRIGWIALIPSSSGEGYSGYHKFEYEIVGKGIPRGVVDVTPEGSPERIVSVGVPEKAEIYPNVTIWFGEPAEWIVSVAIDLQGERVVYDEDYPNLSRPDRFPSPKDTD